MLIVSEEENPVFKTIYVLKKYDIIMAEKDYRRIVVYSLTQQMSHPLLKNPIEFRIRPFNDYENDEEDLEEYIWMLTRFKEVTIHLQHYDEEVVNFVTIRLSNKKNKFSQEVEKRPPKDLAFKFTHDNIL
jgi:hypothetical protein